MGDSNTTNVIRGIAARARNFLPTADGPARTILVSALAIFDQVPKILSVVDASDIEDLVRGKFGKTGVRIADAITLHGLAYAPEANKATHWATGVFTVAVVIAEALDAALRRYTGGPYRYLLPTIRRDFDRQSERAIADLEVYYCDVCARRLDEAEPVFTWVRRESPDESAQPSTVVVCRWCDAALSGT